MKKKILVVEDDTGIREVLKMIFESDAYEIELKEDGQDILKNEFAMPDLFLIDKQLPGMDGLELCRFLKMQPATKNVPVIIVSASPDIEIPSKKAGAADCVEKPFEMSYLLKLVEKHLKTVEVLKKV